LTTYGVRTGTESVIDIARNRRSTSAGACRRIGVGQRALLGLLARLPMACRETAYAGAVWLMDNVAESRPPATDDETTERGRRELVDEDSLREGHLGVPGA
jgi:hypothetical protein